MFKFGFDETAPNAPEWYRDVDKQLERACYDEAVRLAKENAKRFQESGDTKGEIQGMCVYIKALLAMDDVWNAKRFSEQTVELARSFKDEFLQGAATHMLAKTLLKDQEERRVTSITEMDGQAVTFSEMCARLAHKHMSTAEHLEHWASLPSAAAVFAERASQLFASAGNELGCASALITSSGILLKGKQLAEAERAALDALSKFRELGSREGEAAAFYRIYEIRLREEVMDAAVEALESIAACYESKESSGSRGVALLLAAELQRSQADLHSAVNSAATAAQHFHDACDGNNKGHAVLSLANSFLEAEQVSDAIEVASSAVELFKAARNKAGQAQALTVLAQCCENDKRYAEAVYKFEEAAFLHRQRKDKKKEASTLTSLSTLELHMVETGAGEVSMSEPLRHARRAVQLFEETWSGESLQMAVASHTAAKALFSERDREEALDYGKRSRSVYAKLENKVGESAACALLARIYYEDNDKTQGLELSQRSLELAQEAGDQDMLVLATDLVTNQGKKKEQPLADHTDCDILFLNYRICRFEDFEGRRARYKAVDGRKGAQAPVTAIGDSEPSIPKAEDQQKVQYAILWQRVSKLNLASMPTAPNAPSV